MVDTPDLGSGAIWFESSSLSQGTTKRIDFAGNGIYINRKQNNKNMNNELFNMAQASQREHRKDAGYFDGRFAPKQFVDRKKEANRTECRTFRYSND